MAIQEISCISVVVKYQGAAENKIISKTTFPINSTYGELIQWLENQLLNISANDFYLKISANNPTLLDVSLPPASLLTAAGFAVSDSSSPVKNVIMVVPKEPLTKQGPSQTAEIDLSKVPKHVHHESAHMTDVAEPDASSSAADDTTEVPKGPIYAAGDAKAGFWGACDPAVPSSSSSSTVMIRGMSGYIGLVNQAMTCYLNSLIQTLFMTPEFRNAVYNWESSGTKDDESKSIPYQLQKLFLLLQTSDKTALETKDLTKSFGWDSSHAWDQHDVQELCRVMFDALEVKWRKTSQATVINKLYQGTLKDYVKCLECQNENARDDVFLDLPLAIKPFGSQQAYSSVVEALKGFVQFEVLEGSNQYSCSTCNKKCNAHKGLKVTKFPYLLTIQLKRFDFDYTTLHRIKLNDRMTFPDVLNLNPFINETPVVQRDETRPPDPPGSHNRSHQSINVGQQDPDDQFWRMGGVARSDSDDEGIGLDSSSALNGNSNTTSPAESEMSENDVNLINETVDPNLVESYLAEGPFVYELFSIMVHSGSANGGHYYAYIKNLDTRIWYCFNDQVVTRASVEDIRKTYGGPNSSLLYSYSSSTNAYMLMYRQISGERNAKFINSNQLPAHLITLLQRLSVEEADQRRNEEYQRSLTSFKVCCYHPETNKLMDLDLEIPKKTTIDELLEQCYCKFGLAELKIAADRCRLVKFSKSNELIDSSFELQDGKKTVTAAIPWNCCDLLLEIRPEHTPFRSYTPGGVTLKVHQVVINERDSYVRDYFLFYVSSPQLMTVGELCSLLAQHLGCNEKSLTLVLDRFSNTFRVLDVLDKKLDDEVGFMRSSKLFVSSRLNAVDTDDGDERDDVFFEPIPLSGLAARRGSVDEKMLRFEQTTFFKVLDRYKNTITLKLFLPIDSDQILDDIIVVASCRDDDCEQDDPPTTSSASNTAFSPPPPPPPPPPSYSACIPAIETNSLKPAGSDEQSRCSTQYVTPASSRSPTPEDTTFSLAATPSPQVSPDSSPQGILNLNSSSDSLPPLLDTMQTWTATVDDYSKIDVVNSPIDIDPIDQPQQVVVEPEEDSVVCEETINYYFEIEPSMDISTKPDEKVFLVHCDARMSADAFKVKLAPILGAQPDLFKIHKVYGNADYAWNCGSDLIKDALGTIGLRVKLGRPLKDGESLVKIFLFDVKDFQPNNYLFDLVLKKNTKIRKAKLMAKEMLKRKRGLDVDIDRLRFRDLLQGRVELLRDNHTFNDRSSWGMADVYLQILNEPDKLSEDLKLMFVRRWHPSSTALGRLEEICLPVKCSFSEFRRILSDVSHIPADNIEVTRATESGTFPFESPKLKLLEETIFYNCTEDDDAVSESPLNLREDGCLIYYRDDREQSKTLSEEERKEMQIRDNVRFRRTSYTWRKERALKIYTEISSSLQNDDEMS